MFCKWSSDCKKSQSLLESPFHLYSDVLTACWSSWTGKTWLMCFWWWWWSWAETHSLTEELLLLLMSSVWNWPVRTCEVYHSVTKQMKKTPQTKCQFEAAKHPRPYLVDNLLKSNHFQTFLSKVASFKSIDMNLFHDSTFKREPWVLSELCSSPTFVRM